MINSYSMNSSRFFNVEILSYHPPKHVDGSGTTAKILCGFTEEPFLSVGVFLEDASTEVSRYLVLNDKKRYAWGSCKCHMFLLCFQSQKMTFLVLHEYDFNLNRHHFEEISLFSFHLGGVLTSGLENTAYIRGRGKMINVCFSDQIWMWLTMTENARWIKPVWILWNGEHLKIRYVSQPHS